MTDESRILVVDDDETLLKALKRSLSLHALDVVIDADPGHALASLTAGDFAAVVSDYMMPSMDGVSFLSAARAERPDVRRFLMSGNVDRAILMRAVNEAGIHGYFDKPLDAARLSSSVRAVSLDETRLPLAREMPRLREEQAVVRTDVKALRGSGTAPPAVHVLVVDEDVEMRSLVTTRLRAEGYHVSPVDNAAHALAIIERTDVDVIVTDVHLHGIDGLTLLRRVKARAPEIEVIITTASPNVASAVGALQAGAFDFLAKPASQVVTSVARALERRALQSTAALYEASRAILAANDRETLPERIVDLCTRALDADDVSIMLPDREGGLYVAYSSGMSDEVRAKARVALGERVAGKVALTREPVLLYGRVEAQEPAASASTISSSIVYPLRSGDRLLGVLTINRRQGRRPLRQSDLNRAAILAAPIALAMENVQLVRTLVTTEKLATIGQLTSGISHEINNPLAYIMMNAAFLREMVDTVFAKADGPWWEGEGRALFAGAAEAAADLEGGANRIKEIIQDMRSLARSDASLASLFELDTAVRSAVRIASVEVQRSGRLELAVDEKLSVHGNPGQISQVLVNLLVNAAHAVREVPDKAHVVGVTARRDGEHAVIEVSDTGPDITPANLSRIFEPFFTTKPDGKGTGLGLSISHEIVRRHGGELTVRSEPGQGATFTVRLPLAVEGPTT